MNVCVYESCGGSGAAKNAAFLSLGRDLFFLMCFCILAIKRKEGKKNLFFSFDFNVSSPILILKILMQSLSLPPYYLILLHRTRNTNTINDIQIHFRLFKN
jgi:hypothetical protein